VKRRREDAWARSSEAEREVIREKWRARTARRRQRQLEHSSPPRPSFTPPTPRVLAEPFSLQDETNFNDAHRLQEAAVLAVMEDEGDDSVFLGVSSRTLCSW
jgi:hypothetical protein